MNSILTKQNSTESIELLKAQRVAYSQCKRFQVFDVVSVIVAILFPLISLIIPECQKTINAFGVLWTAAYLITELYRKNKTVQGAKIQELFDTQLYGIEWNRILCKTKINIDTIQNLASKYKGNDLKDWYSTKIDNTLPTKIAAILCQRINFSWEIIQRKRFVNFLLALTVLYYLIYVIIGFSYNIGFFDLLILLSPSIPFLVFSVQNLLSLKGHISSKQETLEIIDLELEAYKNQRALPSDRTLRQIQDTIYTERNVPTKVPDWFYKLNKSTNENFIDNLITRIQNNL
jgi:hypothetical protein